MATRSEVNAIRDRSASVALLVQTALEGFWDTLDLTKPEAVRDALLEYVPVLVGRYGDVASTIYADWYNQVRSGLGVKGVYRAAPAPSASAEQAVGAVRYAAGSLFGDTPGDTLANLIVATRGMTIQPGRETIINASHQDSWKPRIARVPVGKTCAFCTVLASRGPVYTSLKTAGQFNVYHRDCDCVPTPVGPKDPLPDGYEPKKLYAQYEAAREEAGGRLQDITAELRQQQNLS